MSNDLAIIGRLVQQISGECRECHCNGDSCKILGDERCCWTDTLRTLCSNPKCQAKAGIKRKSSEREARQHKVKLKGRVACGKTKRKRR